MQLLYLFFRFLSTRNVGKNEKEARLTIFLHFAAYLLCARRAAARLGVTERECGTGGWCV